MRNVVSRNLLLLMGGSLLLSGCGTYHVTSAVPTELRTISVPIFENKTGFPEFGVIATQYTLREIQREGSLKIAPLDSASLKLLCSVSNERHAISFNRAYGSRASEYRYTLVAHVTLVERSTGKLLLDDVPISASTTFLTHDDLLTGMQNSAPRVSKELSRNIIDTVLALWTPKNVEKPAPVIDNPTPDQAPEYKVPEGAIMIKLPQDTEDQFKPRKYR
jgi:outer membrane lipopolysaccharide assembly protein LptE/RlpB